MNSSSSPPKAPARSRILRGNRSLLLALCLASNVFAGFVSTVMAAYLPDAVGELAGSADAATVGHVGAYIGALFLVGWAFGGISFGLLADRTGRARSFTAAVILFSGATLVAAAAPSWPVLVACRLISGFGIGGTMVVSAILVAEAFAERARAIALGFIGVSYPIGIIAAGLVSYSVADWRMGLLVGIAPLVLGVAGGFVVRDGDHWSYERAAAVERRSEVATLLSPAHRSDFLLGATIFGSMSVGLWATFSWLPAWAESLMLAGEGSQQARGILMMVLGSGGIVGGAFSGFLANRLGRRGTLLISFAGSFIASMILFRANTSFSNAVFLQTAVLALFFGISQGTLTVYITELFPTGVRATATGICFNVGRLVTSGAVFFVGVLVPVLGGYGSSLSVFSMMYLLGFAATLLGRETRRTAPMDAGIERGARPSSAPAAAAGASGSPQPSAISFPLPELTHIMRREPFIPLPSHLPGITGLLEYRLDSGAPIRELTQILLRGPSSLSEADRELIATVVSNGNECRFCTAAHTAAAELLLGEAETVEAVKRDLETAPVSEKLRALLRIAARVREGGRCVGEAEVAAAREHGATDREIHDTVLIAALFCLYNRYVDGMASVTPEDPSFYSRLADRIVNRGYLRPEAGFPSQPTPTIS